MKVNLFGVAGLYQNWLMSAIDSESAVQTSGETNFHCRKSYINLYVKLFSKILPRDADAIVNVYVKPENFIWFLFPFFEKTYGVGLNADTLAEDIVAKSDKFFTFHLIKQDIESKYSSIDYDTVVDYVYNKFLMSPSTRPDIIAHVDMIKFSATLNLPEFINVEYMDFYDQCRLIAKLQHLPNFNVDHFRSMYQQLVSRNLRYFTVHQRFLEKLKNKDALNELEMAYVGQLASQLVGKKLAWDNPKFRQAVLDTKHNQLIEQAVKNWPGV